MRTLCSAARRLPAEAGLWTAGLVALALTDPTAPGLLDLCAWKLSGVLSLLELERCPGCGLGHAVAFLLDGQFAAAWRTHPLAPFAVAVLVGRIATLVRAAVRPAPLSVSP